MCFHRKDMSLYYQRLLLLLLLLLQLRTFHQMESSTIIHLYLKSETVGWNLDHFVPCAHDCYFWERETIPKKWAAAVQTTQPTFEAGKNRAFLDNVTGNLWQFYQGISTTSFAVLFSVINYPDTYLVWFHLGAHHCFGVIAVWWRIKVSTNPQCTTVTVQFMLKTKYPAWGILFFYANICEKCQNWNHVVEITV